MFYLTLFSSVSFFLPFFKVLLPCVTFQNFKMELDCELSTFVTELMLLQPDIMIINWI